MIKNYFKIAFRNLWKNKTFTFLNILGLSVAFGVTILLSMTAFFNLSYDQFHKHIDNLYQVYSVEQTLEGPEITMTKPEPYASALKAEVPGVAKISRYLESNTFVTHEDKGFSLTTGFVENDFFSMFSFSVLKGKSENLLEHESSVVLTEKTARKLFGKEAAIGKTLSILLNGEKQPFRITAILKNFPEESSLGFEIAINFVHAPSFTENVGVWNNKTHHVYLQLQKGISAAEFEQQSHAFTALHFKSDIEDAKAYGAQPNKNGFYKKLRLLPFEDIHFASVENGAVVVSRTDPYLILGLAALILFVACVNFINMGIAKSTQRLREVGMRKTLGAGKKQLFFQFWMESALVFISAFGLGILISSLLFTDFKMLFHTSATFDSLDNPLLLLGFFTVFVIITLIAGGYPALLLSKLGTVQALKGKVVASGKNHLRGVLMVLQFGIAILLITGTLVVWNQLQFMRNKDLGFNKEQVIGIPLNGKNDNFMQLFRNELQGEPGILSVTAASDILGKAKDGYTNTWTMGFDYKGRSMETNMLLVDYDFVETLDMELVKGRSFSRKFATDSLSILINQAMAKELQENNVLNTQLTDANYKVIGVLKNYNFQHLNKKIEPLTLLLKKNPQQLSYAYVKVAPKNLVQSFAIIKDAWKKLEPNAAFSGSFLDENIERTFQKEKTMTTIITSGSVIAIVLSCIGLFAISLLVVAQRTKEIGIRKIVGASVPTITFLLVKDFLKLVGIAFLIAAPIAYWLLKDWLQNYAYRIDLNIWIFISAGILALIIALLTMGVKTVKAALQNPVKSLKTE